MQVGGSRKTIEIFLTRSKTFLLEVVLFALKNALETVQSIRDDNFNDLQIFRLCSDHVVIYQITLLIFLGVKRDGAALNGLEILGDKPFKRVKVAKMELGKETAHKTYNGERGITERDTNRVGRGSGGERCPDGGQYSPEATVLIK